MFGLQLKALENSYELDNVPITLLTKEQFFFAVDSMPGMKIQCFDFQVFFLTYHTKPFSLVIHDF